VCNRNCLLPKVNNYIEAASMAPITAMETREEESSKSQSFTDLFIHITSREEPVTTNPSQSHAADIAPLYQVGSPILEEEKTSQNTPEITNAITTLLI